MKHYETMFILKPTLVEEEIKSRIEFFKDIITKNGGEIETCQDMGMRNLAYEIDKNKRGYYFVIYFKSATSLVLELERNYRIAEDILRFIVIKYESKKEQSAWDELVNIANGKGKPRGFKRPSYEKSERPRREPKVEEKTEDKAPSQEAQNVESTTESTTQKSQE